MAINTVILSGMHSGTNPSPGLGIARSLRAAGTPVRIVGLDYSPDSSGLHSDLLDDRHLMPTWDEIELDVWTQQVRDLVDGPAFFISSLDLEVRLIAETIHDPSDFLSPGADALTSVAKPPKLVADALGVGIASWLQYDDDTEMEDFIRRSRSGVWVKGQHYEAVKTYSLSEARRAGRRVTDLWGGAWHAERHVVGREAGIAFVARDGVLLDCVHMRKSVLTPTGKTWAGEVRDVSVALRGRLLAWVAETGWHGGGELEFIESWDGALTLMEVNPRLPAWIHGATVAHRNLPATLLSGSPQDVPSGRSGAFTRVVEEVPIEPTLGAPSFPWSRTDSMPAATKHPSGMPTVARRRLLTQTAPGPGQAQLRPTEDVPPQMLVSPLASTPYLQVDPSLLASRVDAVRATIEHDVVDFAYSVKTNPNRLLIREALRAGMSVEAISQDEIVVAADCGADRDRLILNGPAKWWPPPQRRVAARAVFLDSVPEFSVVNRLLDAGLEVSADVVGVRLARTRMGSRFGIKADDAQDLLAATDALQQLVSNLGCRWGVHFHTAESVIGVDQWVDDCIASLRAATVIAYKLGTPPSLVDFGGGWHARDLGLLPEAMARVRDALEPDVDLSVPWVFELGKSLLEPAGSLFTRVIVPHNFEGDVVVDAGLSDLPEAPHWPHPVFVLRDGQFTRLRNGSSRILGRTCMERDVLAVNLDLDSLQPGDLLAFGQAGGYDSSMSYPFGRGAQNTSGVWYG